MSILTPIANEMVPSGSGVDSSQDCSRLDGDLVDLIVDRLYLDRYVSKTFYGVDFYYIERRQTTFLKANERHNMYYGTTFFIINYQT